MRKLGKSSSLLIAGLVGVAVAVGIVFAIPTSESTPDPVQPSVAPSSVSVYCSPDFKDHWVTSYEVPEGRRILVGKDITGRWITCPR